MPKIPTIIADADIKTGPVGPYADFRAFSGGAEGLYDLGQGASKLAEGLDRAEYRKQRAKAWAEDIEIQEKFTQFHQTAVTFEQDEANASRSDFDAVAFDFLQKQKSEYLKASTSSRVRQALGLRMDTYVNSRRGSILQRTENNRNQQFAVSLDTSLRTTLGAFRQQAEQDPAGASQAVESVRQMLMDGVSRNYDAMAAPYAAKLKAEIDKEIILGTADGHLAYAKDLLKKSVNFDESTRAALENHIEQIGQRRLESAQFDFLQHRKGELDAAWRTGKIVPPIDQQSFEVVFGARDGARRWREFEADRQELNTAVGYADQIADKNPAAAMRELEKFAKDEKLSTRGYNLVAGKVEQAAKRIDAGDAAGWLAENNAQARSAWNDWISAPEPQKPEAFKRWVDTVSRLQGPATTGTPNEDQYLSISSTRQTVVPLAVAKQWAGRLKSGSYQEKLGVLEEFGRQFSSVSAWNKGFRDLLTLPKGADAVRPEYALVFQQMRWKDGQAFFPDPALAQQYLQAVDAHEERKALVGSEKLKKLEEDLSDSRDWKLFRDVLLRQSPANASHLAAYKDGLLAYANATGTGADKAVHQLIGQWNYFGSVNGNDIVIARQRTDGGMRSDDEAEDILRRLDTSLQWIDVDKIDKRTFPQFAQLPENSAGVRKAILQQLMSAGFFEPAPDGNAVTLHVIGEHGISTELTDKSGQPFRIHFDNLPRFAHLKARSIGRLGPRGAVAVPGSVVVKDDPDSFNDAIFPAWLDDEKTNWPIRDWMVDPSDRREMLDTIERNAQPQSPWLYKYLP